MSCFKQVLSILFHITVLSMRFDYFSDTSSNQSSDKGFSNSSDHFDQSGSETDSLAEMPSANASGTQTPQGIGIVYSVDFNHLTQE